MKVYIVREHDDVVASVYNIAVYDDEHRARLEIDKRMLDAEYGIWYDIDIFEVE